MFRAQNRPAVCEICYKDFTAKTSWQRFCSTKCQQKDPTAVLKYKYSSQKMSAADRGIPFLLTFEQWLQIWQDSGHFQNRGKQKGQYCMTRFGDQGPYALGNVKIIQMEENSSEKIMPRSAIETVRAANQGNRYNLGRKHSDETKERMRIAHLKR